MSASWRADKAGRRLRAIALGSTILATWAAVLIPVTAQAQEASPAPAEAARNETNEIIVTAQKRAQNIQDVPIAITAIDNQTLENTAASLSTVNLQLYVPGLVMGRSGTAGATFLRGVGTEAGVAGTESPVATYLDGIYLGVNALGVFELNNIEQVSVLKGPQGTLFGRNATGGMIQITTRDPNLTESEADLEVGYGNYDTSTVRFYGSLPLLPNLAANISLLYKNRGEGTVHNAFTGTDLQAETVFSGQAKLLWEPTDRTQVKLSLIRTDGEDLPGLNYYVQKGALSQDGRNVYLGPFTINLFVDATNDVESTIGALTVTHDFGPVRVTNILTRTDFKYDAFNDQGMTTGLPNPGNVRAAGAFLNAAIDEYTEEFQIQSRDDAALQWILGFFYFNDETDTSLRSLSQNSPGAALTPGFGLTSTMETQSYAGYAQATYGIFPDTNLTVGARFTRDEKEFRGRTVFGGTVPATLPPEKTFDKLTWRIALDHELTSDVLLYASYNRGFRSGTYSPLSLTNPPARPETLDAYEIGVKSDLADNTIRLNAAGFYYDYTDLQIRTNVGSPITSLILNAAEAELYGLDVDFDVRLTDDLRFFGGFELLHAEYTSFPNGPANYPVRVAQLGLNPVTTAPPGCRGTPRTGVGGHTNNTLACDLSGNDMINAPDLSVTVGFDYSIPTSAGEFLLSVADKYTGESSATPDNFQILESYHYVTASLSWTSASDRFYGKIWGTNLGDSDRPAQLASSLATYEFLPGEPLLYGVTIGMRY